MFQSNLFFFFFSQSNLDKWYILVFGLLNGSTLEEFSNTGDEADIHFFHYCKEV